ALRIARAFTKRNKVLKFEGAWHGMHDYGLWGTVPQAPSDYPRASPDSVGVPRETGETVLVTPFNETASAVEMIERHAKELAAVIVEPLQRVLRPEPGFLEAIRTVTKKHGIVLVFDEIVTGFRIAWGGAQEKYGVVPDLACYGKAVSGGYAQRQPGLRRGRLRRARRTGATRHLRSPAPHWLTIAQRARGFRNAA